MSATEPSASTWIGRPDNGPPYFSRPLDAIDAMRLRGLLNILDDLRRREPELVRQAFIRYYELFRVMSQNRKEGPATPLAPERFQTDDDVLEELEYVYFDVLSPLLQGEPLVVHVEADCIAAGPERQAELRASGGRECPECTVVHAAADPLRTPHHEPVRDPDQDGVPVARGCYEYRTTRPLSGHVVGSWFRSDSDMISHLKHVVYEEVSEAAEVLQVRRCGAATWRVINPPHHQASVVNEVPRPDTKGDDVPF